MLRWVVAGLGLSHGSGSSAPPRLVACRPRDLQTFSFSAAAEQRAAFHAGPSPPGFGSQATGGSTERDRRRRKIGGSRTAVHARVPRREIHGEAPIASDDRARETHHPSQPSSAAVLLELQPPTADTNTLAVYGELHRLLGTTRSRQLLGSETVATLTSLNYLVLHHRNGGPSLYDEDAESGRGRNGARLALGHRCWDICGVGHWGPTMDSAMRREANGREPPVADQYGLEREIESVVKITSRSEVISTDFTPAATKPDNKPTTSGASLRRAAGAARQNLQRLYARTRAAGGLAWTPPSPSLFAPSSNTTRASPRDDDNNPLLRVGLGALVSSRTCNTILREARDSDAWAPWDGDLGAGAVATALESLPRSRVLWAGKAGDGVRARIAGLYGVPQSSVVLDMSGVFVCKFGVGGGDGNDDDGDDGRGEPVKGAAERRSTGAARRKTVDGPVMQQQGSSATAAAQFRRSKSLITFSVALSAEDARSSWAVCLEQRGECIRPNDQGSGVIFSGKLRHASVTVDEEDESALQHLPFVLRGFASIVHSSVLQESARWQWGSPTWHVDAPWIKDQDILDRIWMGSRSDVPPEATGQSPAADESLAAAEAAAAGVVEARSSYFLERMNSTSAHRYYRQGLGGMDVPVVDPLGRPVIDLVEDSGKLWLSRLPGVRSDEPAMVTTRAVLRGRFPWDRRRRRQVGKAGFSTQAGTSPRMDAALQELFGAASPRPREAGAGGAEEELLEGVRVPPIKYVFVDPRYRGLGLGRRLFLEAMRSLARRGFRFALIVVEDNGSGGLFGFYEDMGFVRAEEQLGLPRAMIAPIPPPEER